jgi:epoxyqueuosine reductase
MEKKQDNKRQDYPIVTPPYNTNRILLHSCCAPCACEIMEILKRSKIIFTVFFCNPNIDTDDEYEKRKNENINFAKKLKVPFVDAGYIGKPIFTSNLWQLFLRLKFGIISRKTGRFVYNNIDWLKNISGYENEPEHGKRCALCFEMRLMQTAQYAFDHKFKVFTSSLGISRWKEFGKVTQCGIQAAALFSNLTYWTYNWRGKGGIDRMAQISREESFYRQKYCGCSFSRK